MNGKVVSTHRISASDTNLILSHKSYISIKLLNTVNYLGQINFLLALQGRISNQLLGILKPLKCESLAFFESLLHFQITVLMTSPLVYISGGKCLN